MSGGGTAAVAAVVGVGGLIGGWSAPVPLHRFKEWRPKTPRDVANEAGVDIRAVIRHARCPRCRRDHLIGDVAPVLSWARGCPACGRRMPATVWAAQVLAGVSMAVTVLVLGPGWLVPPYLALCALVVAVAVIDARIWLIPWWLPWAGGAIGAVLIVISSVALGRPDAIVDAAIGAAVGFVLLFVLWFVSPSRLGFGDVRLAAVLGLYLGWLHPLLPLYGLLIGSVVGLVVGLVALAAGRGNRFAFGPALGVGALAAVWLHDLLLPT